jgi:hypothetical protein
MKMAVSVLAAVLLLLFLSFVAYGLKTQCPGVIVYVKCYE